ncbi:polyprenol reductase [Copidosoma floridanum]|uniref:polyprenol reductase n=1 Tax=Copidosoma floridanum TaxID=29053 RepID=UPI0006C98943|nr:polyprenol reductase [Copidosoma floridanum]
MNLVKLSFLFNALSVGFVGMLINLFESYIPAFVSKIFRHGKFSADVKDAFLDMCEVPKRWMQHFYILAAPLSTFSLSLLIYRYFLGNKLPKLFNDYFGCMIGTSTPALIPPENVILAITLLSMHCWKRFYECYFLSVFSDVKMSFVIYLVGHCHYIGAVTSIVGESRQLLTDTKVLLNWTKLTYLEILCSIVFLISTYLQYKSNLILASLRKDKKGNVVTKKHKIPKGELFEYVTSPLQFTEICLYVCLSIILKAGSTFHFVTLWVIINQVECAYLSHVWYSSTFENYPKSRKIILPFIF